MIWGLGAGGIPLEQVPFGPWAMLLLGFALGIMAVLSRRHAAARMLSMLVVIALPLGAIAAQIITFSNGSIADVDDVNANFAALNTAVTTLESFVDAGAGENTSLGANALLNNFGNFNTATGANALRDNSTGFSNVALGVEAMRNNLTGGDNTAVGANALTSNTSGSENVALGSFTIQNNTQGNFNTALGRFALKQSTTGSDNTAVGYASLENLLSANGNVALGQGAGRNLLDGNNNIHVGHAGDANESGTIRIGTPGIHSAAQFAGIFDNTVDGQLVIVDPAGNLGTRAAGVIRSPLPLRLDERLAIGGTGFSNVTLNVKGLANDGFLLNLQASDGSDAFDISAGGAMFAAGDGTIQGRMAVGGSGFSDVTLNVKGRSGDAGLLNLQSPAGVGVFNVAPDGSVNSSGDAVFDGRAAFGYEGESFVTLALQTRATDAFGIFVQDANQDPLFVVGAEGSIGAAGDLNIEGTATIAGNVSVETLRIRGGADFAEPFAITGGARHPAGAVLIIDPENPGGLRLATVAYDARVAGVVSGAGGLRPGVVLEQETPGGTPVALGGRVHVLVDADANGPIRPGDMLTTSDVSGHAMRATDPTRSFGAVLGKALTALEEGRGTVLMLVSLQ